MTALHHALFTPLIVYSSHCLQAVPYSVSSVNLKLHQYKYTSTAMSLIK